MKKQQNDAISVSASSAAAIRRKPFRSANPKDKQFSKRFTRSRAGTVFYLLFLTIMGLFCLLPLIYCVATSLKPLDEIMIFPPKFFVTRPTLSNFAVIPELLSGLDVPIERYIFNSLFTTIVTTFIHITVSTMAAFALTKSQLRGKKLIFNIVQFALLFNAYTLSLPQLIIMANMRIIDTYWVYILPHMASTLGVFLMKQYMEGYLSDTYLEAAKIDGAGYFRIFWQIVLPMVKPALLTLTLFAFRDIWAAVPANTVFSEEIKTLPMIMGQISAGGVARTGSAMAVTVIMMIPPIAVYLITQGNVVETMSSSGIKE